MSTVRGKLDLILGIATPSLEEAIWLCRQAERDGATAALVMPPGYFREASEEGIARWFESLLDATGLPILAYNFPKRTGIALKPSLIGRLARHPRFGGVKDSSGERENLAGYRSCLGENHRLFVGDETLLWDALDSGWSGSISGAANVLASWLVQIAVEYPSESARSKFELALPVLQAVRSIPQPAGHKAILKERRILSDSVVSLPLLEASPDLLVTARAALSTLGL